MGSRKQEATRLMLDAAATTLIARFPLGFVATIDGAGNPHLSPKGTFIALDNMSVGFGDIRSPATMANLKRNPVCEVNFIDPFARKALRIKGRARLIEKEDSEFGALFPQWQESWPALAHRIKRIAIIALDAAQHITTPPYDDGVSEEEMVATMKAKFEEIYP